MKFHFFHRWIYTPAVYSDAISETLGIPHIPATRTCSVCNKLELQDIHCLGLNPPKYHFTWYQVILTQGELC
jgi:hypothetical protein